jgi:hypothetical protein
MSVHSPSRVANTETLHFLASDPQTVDPRSGRLLPLAVAQVNKGGLSVLRECATDQEFVSTIELLVAASRAKQQNRYLHSIRHVTTESIRTHDGRRFLGVIDTGYRDRPAHADIFGSKPSGRMAQEKQTMILLSKLDANFTLTSNFRRGVLSPYARR